jgi:hypothetical protein
MLPDMSAKVSFLPRKLAPEEIKPRLASGRSALIDRNVRKFAYLLEGNRVREAPVRVGATFGDMVEIHTLPFYGKSGVLAGNRGERGACPCFAFNSTVVTGPNSHEQGIYRRTEKSRHKTASAPKYSSIMIRTYNTPRELS